MKQSKIDIFMSKADRVKLDEKRDENILKDEKGLHRGSMNILDEKNSDILSKNARNIDSKMPVNPHDPLVGKL